MKARFIFALAVLFLVVPSASFALGLEAAIGGWKHSPSGTLAYDGTALGLESDLNYEADTSVGGRLKVDMPLFIPNVYLVYTPLSYSGTGSKTVDFAFGGKVYSQDVNYSSELTLDHTDIALYYGIPLLETATLDTLNIDLGVNVRLVDFKASVTQSGTKSEKSLDIPIPMAYLGVQVRPTDSFSIEAEARGISSGDNKFTSFLGRLKYSPIGPVFIAAGYRMDSVEIDESGVAADMDFKGPFAEIGLEF